MEAAAACTSGEIYTQTSTPRSGFPQSLHEKQSQLKITITGSFSVDSSVCIR